MITQACLLVVEDDANDVLLLNRALRNVGVARPVRFVGDGEEAVAYLEGSGAFVDRAANPLPALVLLDLKLPRRSGFEVLAWLRAQVGLRRLPVVVFSSSSEAIDVNRAYDLGANSYVTKPVEYHALLDVVRELERWWMEFNRAPDLAGGEPEEPGASGCVGL